MKKLTDFLKDQIIINGIKTVDDTYAADSDLDIVNFEIALTTYENGTMRIVMTSGKNSLTTYDFVKEGAYYHITKTIINMYDKLVFDVGEFVINAPLNETLRSICNHLFFENKQVYQWFYNNFDANPFEITVQYFTHVEEN